MFPVMSTLEDGNEDRARYRKPSRHSAIMRGIVTPIFGLLAVAAVVLGAMNATVWKPSASVTATGGTGTGYVVSDPGVLALVDDQVNVKATLAPSDKVKEATVCMALATSKDAAGWLAGRQVARIKGLADWHTLDISRQKAAGSAGSVRGVPFADSDMWQKVTCGQDKATISLEGRQTDDVLVVQAQPAQEDSTGQTDQDSKDDAVEAADLRMEMHWRRNKLPDFSAPFYFAGGLLAVLAVLAASVFAIDPAKRRKRVTDRPAGAEKEEVTVAQALGTLLTPNIKVRRGFRRSRRQRHALQSGEGHDDETAVRPGQTADASGEGPSIVDIGSRNLVADQEAGQDRTKAPTQSLPGEEASDGEDPEDDQENMTVEISKSEMDSYLARFLDEDAPEGDEGSGGADPAPDPGAQEDGPDKDDDIRPEGKGDLR